MMETIPSPNSLLTTPPASTRRGKGPSLCTQEHSPVAKKKRLRKQSAPLVKSPNQKNILFKKKNMTNGNMLKCIMQMTNTISSRVQSIEDRTAHIRKPDKPSARQQQSTSQRPDEITDYTEPLHDLDDSSDEFYSTQNTQRSTQNTRQKRAPTVFEQDLQITHCITPQKELSETDKLSKTIASLLQATAPSQPVRGKFITYPHKRIVRGEKWVKLGPAEATMGEYFVAILEMQEDKKCPDGWKEHLISHLKELAKLTISYDWQTCRRWSEQIFRLLDNDMIPNGWENTNFITNIQRDVCALGKRLETYQVRDEKIQRYNTPITTITTQTQQNTQTTPQIQATAPQQNIKDFQKERDGKPCFSYNWGRDCGFTANHGDLPNKYLHICAWCAYRYHRTNAHREQECNNKIRFLAGKTGQDFAK